MVDDGVHGIDPQPVNVKFINPLKRIVDEKPSHGIAVRAVEIQRQSPRRLVAVGEIRSKLGEVIPLGAKMVINDVEEKGEAALVARVDQPLQSDDAAIRELRC